jgi:hypothetical protein
LSGVRVNHEMNLVSVQESDMNVIWILVQSDDSRIEQSRTIMRSKNQNGQIIQNIQITQINHSI